MKKGIQFSILAGATTIGLLAVSPSSIFANRSIVDDSIRIGVISDLHLFPKELGGEQGELFQEYLSGDRKMLIESERILDAAIERVLVEHPDIVLVPGDLTKDSERISHQMVAQKLQKLEDQGIEVFIINGNHDINNPDAVEFVTDENGVEKKVAVETVLADEFIEIYDEFGYGQAIAQHEGSVSYVAQLKDGYRLIAIDTCSYGDTKEEQATEGYFREGLIDWVLEQIAEAKEAGDEIIGMMHHGIIEHFDGQATVFAPYVVEGYEEASQLFADAGLKYMFTGHFHAQDVAAMTTKDGNTIYDIMTGALVTAPSPVRYVEINSKLDRFESRSEFIASIEGEPDFQTYANNFLKAGIPDMVVSLLQEILLGLFQEESYSVAEVLEILDMEEGLALLDTEANYLRSHEGSEALTDIVVNDDINLTSVDSHALISMKQIREFIIAVTNELKTATLPNTAQYTSTGDDKKIMDVIEECLVQVYHGDETYSTELQNIRAEMGKGIMIPQMFTDIIYNNRMKLGITGALLSKDIISSLFDIEVSEGTTVGVMISAALGGLVDGLLTDPAPADNNFLLYGGQALTATMVESAIEKLPADITLANKELINVGLYIYNDLSDEEKSLVSNYEKLSNAQVQIINLEADINNVISMIDQLPETISLNDKDIIETTRAAYDSLTDEQKALVTNLDKLKAAEEDLTKLIKDANPGEDNNKPGEDNNKPGEDNNKPGEDNNKPGGDSNKPGGDNNKPGGDSNNSGGDNNNSGGDNNKPGGDNNKPGGDSNNSGGDNNNLDGKKPATGLQVAGGILSGLGISLFGFTGLIAKKRMNK